MLTVICLFPAYLRYGLVRRYGLEYYVVFFLHSICFTCHQCITSGTARRFKNPSLPTYILVQIYKPTLYSAILNWCRPVPYFPLSVCFGHICYQYDFDPRFVVSGSFYIETFTHGYSPLTAHPDYQFSRVQLSCMLHLRQHGSIVFSRRGI